jgi:hypothetical protein
MPFLGTHSISCGGDGEEEMAEERECGVGDGEWEGVGGEAGAAERLNRSQRLNPEKEGGSPTGEFIGEGICLIGEGPSDGFYPLHKSDGRTEKEESGVKMVLDADEDGEGAECERLERDGCAPAHLVGEEVCFWGVGGRR